MTRASVKDPIHDEISVELIDRYNLVGRSFEEVLRLTRGSLSYDDHLMFSARMHAFLKDRPWPYVGPYRVGPLAGGKYRIQAHEPFFHNDCGIGFVDDPAVAVQVAKALTEHEGYGYKNELEGFKYPERRALTGPFQYEKREFTSLSGEKYERFCIVSGTMKSQRLWVVDEARAIHLRDALEGELLRPTMGLFDDMAWEKVPDGIYEKMLIKDNDQITKLFKEYLNILFGAGVFHVEGGVTSRCNSSITIEATLVTSGKLYELHTCREHVQDTFQKRFTAKPRP